MTSVDPGSFTHLSFDCYGTLVDWESGLLSAMRPLLDALGADVDDAWILSRYALHESAIEAGDYVAYAEVLRRVVHAIARDARVELRPGDDRTLVRSVPSWPVFPDTVAALERLASRYALVVASNVDDGLFRKTAPSLGVSFSAVITAEQLRSYKPARAHFDAILARTGAPVDRVLHVAQSLYHDHTPARALGFRTAWVNRPSVRPGVGVAPASAVTPDVEVPDLATLATRLEV